MSIVKRFSAEGLTLWSRKINYPRPPPQSIPVTTSLSEPIMLGGLRRRRGRVIEWGEEKVKSQLGWKFRKRGRKKRLRKRSQEWEEMNRDDKPDTLGGTNSDLCSCPGERKEREEIWGQAGCRCLKRGWEMIDEEGDASVSWGLGAAEERNAVSHWRREQLDLSAH